MTKQHSLLSTWNMLRAKMPAAIRRRVMRIFPLQVIASLSELLGLAIILPLINIILNPALIDRYAPLRYIRDQFGLQEPVHFVTAAFSAVVLVFILKNLLVFLLYKLLNKLTFDFSAQLAARKYDQYMNSPYAFHAENNSAVLMRNILDIPLSFVTMIFQPFLLLVNEAFILIILVISLLVYDPLLFISILAFSIPFLWIYNRMLRQKLRRLSQDKDEVSKQLYKQTRESLASFREVMLFGKAGFFRPQFRQLLGNYSTIQETLGRLNAFSPKLIEMVAVFCLYGIFIAGLIFGRNLASLAQFLIVFAIATYRIIPSVNKVILCMNYIKAGAYTIDYVENATHENETEATATAGQKEQQELHLREAIELRNISFRYNDDSAWILDGLSMRIPRGQTVGIIGRSGAGKTTLLNILLRLHTESAGQLCVDNTVIGKENTAAWRKLTSYVPQNIVLLDGTVAENIAFGIAGAEIDHDRLREVIRKAQLESFIDQLPDKLLTPIGENGIKISGGQRQRIGIARALYHGGEVLIFDEATSALDPETERSLTEDINRLAAQELTLIIVAHRLQTLSACDAVYIMRDGKPEGPLAFEDLAAHPEYR